MKFGLWDHVDRNDRRLDAQLDERLEFLAAADAGGFHCFHVAEHHATPLNLVPVPGVFLGAVARATTKMRLGPLVYLLPLYSPLRLIEEICILDHLSHGRLEVGVGRGVSPFELNYHNVDAETSREVFLEALEIVKYGLTHERLDHAGKHFSYADVPMELKPLQQPHPAIWYPSSNPESAAWAGAQGYNYVTLGGVERVKAGVAAYREALETRGGAEVPNDAFPEGAAIGANRHVVVADTDEDALRIAKPAHESNHASLMKLWNENVKGPAIAQAALGDVADSIKAGATIVGTPDTVAAEIERQVAETGINYMTCGLFFGTISFEDAKRSLDLFVSDVMPRFAAA